MSPLFSIITVVRNAPSELRVTLESVKAQTCGLYEQIVIDGASTDATPDVARNSGIDNLTLISEPDKGIYDAMNKGLALAQGDYVMFLNAGDTLAGAGTLQAIADVVMDRAYDYPGVVYGQTRIVDTGRNALGPRHLVAPDVLTVRSFADGMVVCHQAFIVLRKLAERFDTRYRYSADYDWCINCLTRSKRNAYMDRVLVDYLMEGQTTAHRRASLWERFLIMKKHFGLGCAVAKHVGFVPRYLKRQKLEKKWQKDA